MRLLLQWYRRHGRKLPWRDTLDPYRIWVSEAMLQQTTVKAVVPYYERFLGRFPDVQALARADLADVLAAWSGLGYYRRARHLKAAAERVLGERGGRLPDDPDALAELPGFGPYMAAAVASMAFDRPHPPVDANVRRVAARLFAIEGAGVDRRVAAELQPLFDAASPRLLANALMDLGATVCLPRQPRCPACPWRADCAGRDAPERLGAAPLRARPVARVACALAVVVGGSVWLEQRRRGALLEGFWDLPHEEAGGFDDARRALAARLPPALGASARKAGEALRVRHTIMNRRILRRVLRVDTREAPRGGCMVPLAGPWALPLSGAARKCLAGLARDGRPAVATGSG